MDGCGSEASLWSRKLLFLCFSEPGEMRRIIVVASRGEASQEHSHTFSYEWLSRKSGSQAPKLLLSETVHPTFFGVEA